MRRAPFGRQQPGRGSRVLGPLALRIEMYAEKTQALLKSRRARLIEIERQSGIGQPARRVLQGAFGTFRVAAEDDEIVTIANQMPVGNGRDHFIEGVEIESAICTKPASRNSATRATA